LERAVMDLKPPPGRVPEIWIAAHGPRMLELTGRFGDGWYPTFPMRPPEYAEKLEAIGLAAERGGRDRASIVAGMQIFLMVAPTREEARQLLSSKAARFVALLASDEVWNKLGLTHPLGEGFGGMIDFVPQSYSREELEDAIAAVPVRMLEESGVWGTPNDVVGQ
ncbi:MAG: LLM class flavin-dependent oxidoreductase, partial [Akkermansiaceae bacterium]|nr:LLM class flavin-dependent oxidoreductase [Akkermansiaceae bacterium]